MFIIVGLGNPGEEYTNTRHNTGRIMVEAFARANDFSEFVSDKKLKALVSVGKLATHNLQLILPETFMNKSGVSVAPLVKTKKAAEQLVVVHDDLDIPFGKFKVSFNKSSGGHRGVESINKAIKTEGYIRVRVGISPYSSFTKGGAGGGGFKLKKPHGEEAVNKFILAKFKPAETEEFKKLSKKVADALAMIATIGREKAMGEFNKN